jgi:outer membrane protein TolC
MVADVAENYYELMALDNTMLALDKTIEIQQQSLEMSEAKKRAGRETELAVQRFAAEVSKNQSEKLIVLQEIIEVENEINFTLGRYPQPVERVSANFLDLNLQTLSLGVPSQLLQNRADIRQAERELAAAGLDVRVARARFYPSLNLNGTVGYEAFNTKYLFLTPESLIYGLTGDLVAPLINRAAIKADYLTANAMQIEKVYDYQRTVLTAFTEVINRLAKVENYGRSIELKKQQLHSLEASVDNATKLFQNARAEYMDVLLAQRDMMEAKMVLIDTKQEQLSAVVNAYQALGGGRVSPQEIQLIGSGRVPATAIPAPPMPEPVPAVPQPLPEPLPDPESQPSSELTSPRVPDALPEINDIDDVDQLDKR